MALNYAVIRPLTYGGTAYALGDSIDLSGASNNTIINLLRNGWITADDSSVGGGGQDVIYHGDDSTVARPTSAASSVLWIGSVEPDNWTTDDLWYDTDADAASEGGSSDGGHIADHEVTSSALIGGTETLVETFAVDLPASRRVKVQMVGEVSSSSGAASGDEREGWVRLREGTDATGTRLMTAIGGPALFAVDGRRRTSFGGVEFIEDTGAGGSTDYAVTLQRVGGSQSVELNGSGEQPTKIVFTDVGPA